MHEQFMRRCIELAMQAKANGNIPVGALVTLNGSVVAEAFEVLPNSLNITGHAEILAVQRACDKLQTILLEACVLYTTAEPCWMCSYAIRETRISTVVIGSKTEDVGGISTQYPLLVDDTISVWGKPPDVVMGVLEEDCSKLRK